MGSLTGIKNKTRNLIGEQRWSQLKKFFTGGEFVSRKQEYLEKPSGALSPDMLGDWQRHGYLVLPGFFSADTIAAVNEYLERLWRKEPVEVSRLVIDVFIGQPEERRMAFRDAPPRARYKPYKLNDLFLESALVRSLLLDQRLSEILAELLGGAVLLCNSLNFEFGSQQDFHTDSLYMTPPRGLNLIATWTALEDCRPEAGPLRYFPGSHQIKPYRFSSGHMTAIAKEMPDYERYMRGEVQRRGLREERFCAKAGDVFIWHSQLFHGGAAIDNPALTRRSLVAHYFRASDVAGEHPTEGRYRFYQSRAHQPF